MGTIRDWNETHPTQKLKKGDKLVSAMGDEGGIKNALAAACCAGAPLTLHFRRPCPNAEQLSVLEKVAARVERECLEERAELTASSNEDPLPQVVHGLPGTGKNRVIAWIGELFVDVLEWTSGALMGCGGNAHLRSLQQPTSDNAFVEMRISW